MASESNKMIKQSTEVRPVTDKVTVVRDTSKKRKNLERQIVAAKVLAFRDVEHSLVDVLENYIQRLVEKQKENGLNYLQVDIELDLVKRTLTLTDNGVGLTSKEISALPFETRFAATKVDIDSSMKESKIKRLLRKNYSKDERISDEDFEVNNDFTLLELGAYFGSFMELLTVTEKHTKWFHIDFNTMLNTETVILEKEKNIKNVDLVKSYIPHTGTKLQVTEVPYAYDKGWLLLPSPENVDKIREELAITFSETMQTFDLILRVMYKAKVVSDDYLEKRKLKFSRK